MTTETITDEFVCDVCGGHFKSKAGLGSHRRTHKSPDETKAQPDDPRIVELEKQLEKANVDSERARIEYEAQLKDALTRAEEAEAEAEEFKPTRDASMFLLTDADSVVERFGEQKLRDLAQRELATVNRRRAKDNLPPIEYSDGEREEAIKRVIESLLADRASHGAKTEGPIMKTIKMITPAGHLVQPPFEAQINNQAGSLEDAVAIYRRKGYKIAVDDEGRTLCPAQDCYDSAIMEGGKYTFGGYCSADHQQRTEGNSRPVDRSIYTRTG